MIERTGESISRANNLQFVAMLISILVLFILLENAISSLSVITVDFPFQNLIADRSKQRLGFWVKK